MPATAETKDLVTEVAAQLAARLERNFQIIPTLTLSQAAQAVGVSDETMRKLCQTGEIPFIKVERLYRIKPADVNAYLERNYHAERRPRDTPIASAIGGAAR